MENVGTLTKNGNPRHLSRVDYITFSDFNMQELSEREPVIRKMRILMQRKQRRHGQAAGPGGWIRPLQVQKKRIGFYGSAIIE